MHITYIFRSLGLMLATFSLAMLPPAFVALIYNEQTIHVFTFAAALIFATGFLMWFPLRKNKEEPHAKDELRKAFAAADLKAEVEVYKGALHGWCPPDSPVYGEAHAEHACPDRPCTRRHR